VLYRGCGMNVETYMVGRDFLTADKTMLRAFIPTGSDHAPLGCLKEATVAYQIRSCFFTTRTVNARPGVLVSIVFSQPVDDPVVVFSVFQLGGKVAQASPERFNDL
jgi:hypothetical protein